jgi:hypothetical protein
MNHRRTGRGMARTRAAATSPALASAGRSWTATRSTGRRAAALAGSARRDAGRQLRRAATADAKSGITPIWSNMVLTMT